MLDDVEQRLGQIQVAEQGHEGARRPAQELGEGSQVEGHDPHLLDVLERGVAPSPAIYRRHGPRKDQRQAK